MSSTHGSLAFDTIAEVTFERRASHEGGLPTLKNRDASDAFSLSESAGYSAPVE